MDNIAKHHASLIARYVSSNDAPAIVRSAQKLAYLVLTCTDPSVLEIHKQVVIKQVLWMISSADGKYSTRFRSAEVVNLATNDNASLVGINHEHVFPIRAVRAEILRRRDELVDSPESLNQLLSETVGCVVTHDEHRRLSNLHIGWERYEGVEVLDMSEVPPVVRRSHVVAQT